MMPTLRRSPHSFFHPWYSGQRASRIEPTDDAGALIAEAVRMLAPLWRDGLRYIKVGVMQDDLRDKATQPRSLFPSRDPDMIIVPLGILLAVRLVPPDLMAEFRAEAERREGRPTSRIGAAAIVTLWIASAVFLLWWFWPNLAG